MARRWLLWIAAIVAIPFLLIPPLLHGWTHVETDFPNYYTAAWMARHHVPLRDLYDWTSFQRQMNYAGWGLQLGGYIPHTPLTALPMVPLAALDPMTAKRVWLAFSVACLAAAIWMLSRLTHVSAAGLILLALAGHYALAGNLELGQYYFFLLFLMTASLWLLFRERGFSAGLLLGAIFILKLYAGPFLLYFAWKRHWRALAGMAVSSLILAIVSVIWFGWADHVYYLRDILPRAVAGEHIDPYATGMPTILNMIRHAFQAEPSLNPHPLVDAPALVFFLQPLLTLAIPILCLIAIPRINTTREDARTEIAWFLIMLVLVSPSRAFYASVLLLLPVALLLESATLRRVIWLISAYLLVSNALPEAWEPLFLSIWVLLAAYVALGIPYWRKLRPAVAAAAAIAIVGMAGISSMRRMASFHREPPQKCERVAFEKDAIYSGTPAASSDGVVYESIDDNRYLLKRWDGKRLERYPFDGQAFHPSTPASGGPIYFELVADRHSRIMSYNRKTKELRQILSPSFEATQAAISPDGHLVAFTDGGVAIYTEDAMAEVDSPANAHDVAWFPDNASVVYSAGPAGSAQIFAARYNSRAWQLTKDAGDHAQPAVSPDGQWLAYTLARGGMRQIWIQNLATGKSTQLTEGNCNSFSPAWERDSRALIFACDCQRGIGLPALFRARLIR